MAPSIRQLSIWTVKPHTQTHHDRTIPLTAWDLARLNGHYIQKGLLFSTSTSSPVDLPDRLKSSLALALDRFYPLAGRLVTDQILGPSGDVIGTTISVHCNGQGAQFVHSVTDTLTVADVITPSGHVPDFVHSLFALTGLVNYDGHSAPLLAVQLTELVDGFFIGCSFNHSVGDGTSYWHFFNQFASISRGELPGRPPVHERWFVDGEPARGIVLPFHSMDGLIERFQPAPFVEKFFLLSAKSIAELKSRANCSASKNAVYSSLQSVISLVWRAIVRARRQPFEQVTSAKFTIEARSRLPLSPDYFGNAINVIAPSTSVGELLTGGLGLGAELAHGAVWAHTGDVIRESYRAWLAGPTLSKLSLYEDGRSVMLSSSPRFDMYGCDFGYGKAVAVRSGFGSKFDGKVWLYPGREGGGSMDLEICLAPENMKALESDEEFMSAVSVA